MPNLSKKVRKPSENSSLGSNRLGTTYGEKILCGFKLTGNAYVRFGSSAASHCNRHVRFTPERGHSAEQFNEPGQIIGPARQRHARDRNRLNP
jgi:hypothetical protein